MVEQVKPVFREASIPAAGSAEKTAADIGLLLEGTYPYIRGGVSSWVHQIISGLPDIRFAIDRELRAVPVPA